MSDMLVLRAAADTQGTSAGISILSEICYPYSNYLEPIGYMYRVMVLLFDSE
jgi:hypothetical protein